MNIFKFGSQDINLHPEINAINLIDSKAGIINLPNTIDLCFVEILFQCKGLFAIKSTYPVVIGNKKANIIVVNPGTPGYDMNTAFIFDPEHNEWFIRSIGLFMCYDSEDSKKAIEEIDKIYKENYGMDIS